MNRGGKEGVDVTWRRRDNTRMAVLSNRARCMNFTRWHIWFIFVLISEPIVGYFEATRLNVVGRRTKNGQEYYSGRLQRAQGCAVATDGTWKGPEFTSEQICSSKTDVRDSLQA